jgi:hypothetical protein
MVLIFILAINNSPQCFEMLYSKSPEVLFSCEKDMKRKIIYILAAFRAAKQAVEKAI